MALRSGPGGLIGPGFLLLAAACGTPGPRPLAFGTETCAHCHMTLADPRFAAELVMTTGRVIPFDDAGCLASYLQSGVVAPERVRSLWVGQLVPLHRMLEARDAVFLISEAIHTPMDYHVAALTPGPEADSVRAALGGELVSWDRVLRSVRTGHGAGGVAP